MPSPWRSREARWVAAVGIVCLVLLTLCWYQAAGEGHTSDQMPWLDVAAAGVALYWVLAGRVVSRARRRVAARRQVQFAALAQPRWDGPGAPRGDTPYRTDEPSGGLVVASGMTRAHRPECPLVAGKATGPAPTDAPACGICG